MLLKVIPSVSAPDDTSSGDSGDKETSETVTNEESIPVDVTSDGVGDEDNGEEGTELPVDFPGKLALEQAGITTYEQVRAVDDLTQITGIGAATAAKIEEALDIAE